MVYDKGAAFEPASIPSRYPMPQPGADGVWRDVLGDDGTTAVGVIWTDRTESAGIRWITQTDSVMKLFKDLHRSALAGVAANDAYQLALKTPGARFGDEQSGPVLTGINDTMAILMGRDN